MTYTENWININMLGALLFTLCIEWLRLKCSGYKNINEYYNFSRKINKIITIIKVTIKFEKNVKWKLLNQSYFTKQNTEINENH